VKNLKRPAANGVRYIRSILSQFEYKMELVPTNPALFKTAMEALKEFLVQLQINISETGISVSGMDASHVGFVDYKLSAADCSTLKTKEHVRLGIHTAVLTRALAACDSIHMTTTKNKEKLVLTTTNEKVGKKAVFEIPTLDIEDVTPELPEITYNATVELKTADFASVVKDVASFGDAVTLTLDEGGLHIKSSGDCGSVVQTLENTDDRTMELGVDSVTSSFGSKHLLQIMKGGGGLAPIVRVEFDPAQPLRVTFKFGTDSHFIAYLAPKINDD
jgi:proliferating cell nuclear antigen PCNA